MLINHKISIERSPIHGWGVFTIDDIQENTLIIQSPGIILKGPSAYIIKEIAEYTYPFNRDVILCFGYASLINSSDEPNVKFEVDIENKIINITTIKNIKSNEEITFKYL